MSIPLNEHLEQLIQRERLRLETIKKQQTTIKASSVKTIGVLPGDGIGPLIMEQSLRVLRHLLKGKINQGEVKIHVIEGLTLENRIKLNQAVPDSVIEEAKKCTALLKGPTTTPKATDGCANVSSANATLRRELDLYAALRKIEIPERKIDWTFFRENIEGAYLFGSDGILIDDEIAIDFVVETRTGGLRIARRAFEYAKQNNKESVTAVAKANIVKLTDGNFLKHCQEVAKDYPDITYNERMVDVTASQLNNPAFHQGLSVFVLPNLYGDIITDIAAEIQGGVGATGSANIGDNSAIFETTHGTAPYLIENNLGDYASPRSLLKSVVMLLEYLNYLPQAKTLDEAMKQTEHIIVNGNKDNKSAKEYVDELLKTIDLMNH